MKEELTALREVQQRLVQAEGTLTRLLNHLPGVVYRCRVTEGYGYILEFISKGCSALLGRPPEHFLAIANNSIERMMPDEDLLLVRDQMHKAILVRQPWECYYRVRRDNGEERWVWDQGEGIYNAAGTCSHVEGILMDVTAQKRREILLQEENFQLRSSLSGSSGLGRIVGKSPSMQQCCRLLLRASKGDTNVVLYGETGVGKDLAARAIHELSGGKGTFVPVNCAAIPEQLMESEFFGHVRGAFSGAVGNHAGYLATANGGTLFLDEVGELPLSLQGKLLRALESKSYTPVGSNEVRRSNFRLICATNRDLAEQVSEKTMRPDFFYRIHVLPITLPPLRERPGDLVLLAEHYSRIRGYPGPLPASLLAAMEQYSWPGNVRELQNALDRFWAFGETAVELAAPRRAPSAAAALEGGGRIPEAAPAPSDRDGQLPGGNVGPLNLAREDMEAQRIRSILEQCGWKKGKSAEMLGVTIRTLQRKVKRYGISR